MTTQAALIAAIKRLNPDEIQSLTFALHWCKQDEGFTDEVQQVCEKIMEIVNKETF